MPVQYLITVTSTDTAGEPIESCRPVAPGDVRAAVDEILAKHRRIIDAQAWQEIETAEWAMDRWQGESRILLGHLRRIYIDALEVPVGAWEAEDRFAQLRGRAPKRRSSLEEEW